MKRSLIGMHSVRSILIALFLSFLTMAVNAQQPSPQCDTEALTTLYQKFLDDHEGKLTQLKTANETATQYLKKFGDCPGQAEQKIATFIRKWQVDLPARVDELNCTDAIEKIPAQAFTICRPHMARNPENLRTHLLLSLAGIRNSGTKDAALKSEAARSARKALELIKGGATATNWVFGSKEAAIDTLEFYSAYFTLDTEPIEAAQSMLKLAHSSSSYNKDPNTYFYLARSLHDGEVKKQIAEYNSKCAGNAATTPDCDKFNDNIEATIDRVIDAYARAIALSAGKSEHAALASSARPLLVDLYKQRHQNSEAGLDKLIAEVLTRPLP